MPGSASSKQTIPSTHPLLLLLRLPRCRCSFQRRRAPYDDDDDDGEETPASRELITGRVLAPTPRASPSALINAPVAPIPRSHASLPLLARRCRTGRVRSGQVASSRGGPLSLGRVFVNTALNGSGVGRRRRTFVLIVRISGYGYARTTNELPNRPPPHDVALTRLFFWIFGVRWPATTTTWHLWVLAPRKRLRVVCLTRCLGFVSFVPAPSSLRRKVEATRPPLLHVALDGGSYLHGRTFLFLLRHPPASQRQRH
jgi:hypothetical protein